VKPSYGNYRSGSHSAYTKPESHSYQPTSVNRYDEISPSKKYYGGYQNKYQPDTNHGFYSGPTYQKAGYETSDNYERYRDSANGKYKPGQGCTCP
jgi:hypothetical protein